MKKLHNKPVFSARKYIEYPTPSDVKDTLADLMQSVHEMQEDASTDEQYEILKEVLNYLRKAYRRL